MNCKSCSSEINENTRYCSNCGSKIVHDRLSLKGTWEEFIGPFFSWDNNFWRTFIGLFKNPKDVLEAYISGARKKYFNPFSYLILFATIAVLFYKFFPMGEIEQFSNGFNNGYNSPDSSVNAPKLDMKPFMESMMNYYNFVFILIIPFMAITTYFTFYKQKNNFPEHLVFNAYLHTNLGFFALFLQLLFLNIMGISFGIYYLTYTILAIIFSVNAFSKLYKLNTKQIIISIIKFWVLLLVLYLILLILGGALFFLYMILTR
ncbi:DUF3667 domain-containing protein [uncultured Flavobacterium sp.]|uniref:DUF3667 domain-containing protein n=1 Tax=uncultured Flavobacterium sp. TaxID=165435 RepID=UPI0030C7EC02